MRALERSSQRVHEIINFASPEQDDAFRPEIGVTRNDRHPQRQGFPHRRRIAVKVRRSHKHIGLPYHAQREVMRKLTGGQDLSVRRLHRAVPDQDQPQPGKPSPQLRHRVQQQREAVLRPTGGCHRRREGAVALHETGDLGREVR